MDGRAEGEAGFAPSPIKDADFRVHGEPAQAPAYPKAATQSAAAPEAAAHPEPPQRLAHASVSRGRLLVL